MTPVLKFSALALLLALAACGSEPEATATSEGSDTTKGTESVSDGSARAPQRAELPPEPTVPTQPAMAPGHYWYLVDASSSTLSAQSSRTAFQMEVREARLAGQSGCNRFDAALAYDSSGQIRIDAPASTRRICQDEAVNAAEREYLQTLPKMRTHRLVGQRLRLESEDATLWLEYEHGRRPQGASLAL